MPAFGIDLAGFFERFLPALLARFGLAVPAGFAARAGFATWADFAAPALRRAPTRTVPRKWTPPEAFKADIVAVLEDAGGELEQEDLFRALEERVAERLTEADHQTTPEGELRWRYAARRARQALITEGAMVKGRPGVWALG